MKKIIQIISLIGFTFIIANSKAQLAGTFSVPATYSTIAAAILDLNTQGVNGPVTIQINAGYTETAPVGGYTLTATGTALNPITFVKNGAGANPLITAYAGGIGTPATAIQDGVWRLVGSDYVTIDGIDIVDPNGANPATMEFGYGLFKASATDGCQNNTIRNCVITLNRVNNVLGTAPATDGSRGVDVVNALTGAHTTAVTVSSAAGTNSNNRFYSNTIQNCNIGIALIGFAAASPFTNADQNNDVGGLSALTGNTIINYGGGAGATNPAAAVRTLAQYSINVSYNTINSNNGAGVNHPAVLRGIYLNTATSANATVSNNTLTVKGGGTTSQISVIENVSGSTAASNTVNITNNVITNCTYSTVTSGAFYFILNSASPAFLNINNNSITGLTLNAAVGSGGVNFLYNSATIGSSLSVASNSIQNITNLNTTGIVYFIYGSNSTVNYTVQNNYVNNITRAAGLGGTMYGYYNFGSPGSSTGYVTNNVFSNLNAGTGASTFYGTYYATLTSHNQVVTNNLITNITGGSTVYGIYYSYGNTLNAISGNTVSNVSGTGTIYGINYGSTASTSLNVNNNIINTLSSTGASPVYAIYQGGSTNTSVFKNKIYDISGSNASSSVYGIYVSFGTTSNFYNNLIGDLRTPSANASIPLAGIYVSGGTTANIYYNTVRLNATSAGALFGSAAMYASTAPNLCLRNNVFINLSTPSGAGITMAYGRTANAIGTYSNSSNNNLFYAGTPGTNNLIFYDGTNSLQTLSSYTAFVTPRDANSITENTSFLSVVGLSANFLHVNPSGGSITESAAANIAGITDDYDADIRQGNPGYVGSGTAPDIGADEYNSILPNCNAVTGATISPATATRCAGQTVSFNASGFTTGTGITQQWQVSNSPGGPYSNVVGGVGANGTSYVTATLTPASYYYILLTTCTISGLNAISNEATVTVVSIPVVSVTPNTSTICMPGGSSVALNASGANNYTWTPAAGLTGTVGAVVNALPAATTIYTVTGANLAGCISTATTIVNIGATPNFGSISASPTLVCGGGNSSLQATGSLPGIYSVSNISFAPIPSPVGATTLCNAGTQIVPLSAGSLDDGGWYNIQIPFNFNFFGVTYTACAISTNGFISLGGGTPYTYNGYGNSFPSAFAGQPCIGGVYGDLDYRYAGIISTFTTGVIPNRTMVFNFAGGQFYSNTGALTHQIIIYESSNVIESHITNSTGNNFTSEVIQNANGTIAYPVPGRNYASWSVAVSDAYRWSPGAVTYSWIPSTYLNFTNISNPVANSVTAGITYTAIITSTSTGCTNSNTITLAADISPTVTITGSNSICNGDTLNLTANGAVTYSWSNGAATPSIVVTPTANITYSVVGTSSAGCTAFALQSVTVNATPTVVIAGSNTVCAGQPVSLTASGANTYSWNNGALTNTIAPTPTVNTTYSVVGTTTAGCFASASKSVNLIAFPQVTITSAPAAICAGQTASLIASAAGADTYSWSNGANGVIIAVSPSVNTTYTITVGSNLTGCTNFAVQTLTVNSLPTVAINGMSVICPGTILNLTASGANTYTWSNGANTVSISVTPTVNSSYTVYATSAAGCSGNAVQSVTVNPALNVIVTASSPSICLGSSANLFANGASTYSWNTGSTSFSIVVSPTVNSTYTVTGTSSVTGCTDTKTIGLVVDPCSSTGIKQVNPASGGISLYPNPNTGEFIVEWNNGANKTIVVTDLTGRIVLELSGADDKIPVSINNLANGIYQVKVQSNNVLHIFKVVKQ